MPNKQNISYSNRKFLKPLMAVIALTLASGTLYGRLTQRWGPPADLVAAAEHVHNFPKQLGDWRISEDRTMPDSTRKMLECAGYVNRRYINQETGQSIGLAIIVGPPGPTAVHTPEICYSSKSHKIMGPSQQKFVEEQEHSFWGIRFESRHAGAQQLQVYYAWNNGLQWEASNNPRIQFGGNQLLYKVQISGDIGLGLGKGPADPAWEFINALSKSSWSPSITKSISN